MPLYEYQCESCAKRFERIQKYSDPPIDTCPSCGAHVKKLMSSPAIQFKGSGFYITDYRSEGYKASAKSETASSKADSSSAAPAKTESKADSKSASKPAPAEKAKPSPKKD